MTHDSNFTAPNVDHEVNVAPRPRNATLSFLRQFARTYAILPGTVFSAMSVN